MAHRILLIHRVTEGLGDSFRVKQKINFLKSSGYEVHEIILPLMPVRSVLKRKLLRQVSHDFWPIREFKIYRPKNPLLQLIMINVACNYLRRIMQQIDFDLILAETSFVGWLVLQTLDNASVPFIVDIHGLFGAEARSRGDRFWHLREELEKEVFKHCTHLLVVTNELKRHIIHQFQIPAEKITVITNGSIPRPLKAQYNYPLKVIFAGLFGYWENIDDYLDLAKAANSKDFTFYLAGDGILRDHIFARIRNEQVPIKYLGRLSRNKMNQILSKMQIGVAPSTKDQTRLVAFPIKVLDYMSHGLPVVAPYVGDWGQMIENEQCGVALKDDSIDNYLMALESLKIKDLWDVKSNNGVRAIQERYNWNNVMDPLKSILHQFLK